MAESGAMTGAATPQGSHADMDAGTRMRALVRRWWRMSIVATVGHEAVLAKVREEGFLTTRYVFMLAMSAGIAVLGLLLSSPAVVIGAMLLSPLMGPIIASGFGLATGDFKGLRQYVRALVVGTVFAILFCALIVMLSPLQTVTTEIAARTRPNLFDLVVALFSSLAGTYAMIRGREGTIVGVAIATALMPPLAVVGFGLATLNWTVFSGALLLYVTNLMTISLTSAIMARFYGFRTALTKRQTIFQTAGIVLTFIALALPLGFSLSQIAWEANASRAINGRIKDAFDPRARVSQMDIDYDAEPIAVTASVLTPDIRPGAEDEGALELTELLGQPIALTINQYKVGTGEEAEAAQINNARAQEQAAASARQIDQMTDRLALVAGVVPERIVIDREQRRAIVTARPITGAGLATYRELERRVAATAPDWSVELRPPPARMPDLVYAGDTPDAETQVALPLIAWGSQRLDLPVRLTGRATDVARAATALQALGAQTAGVSTTRARAGRISTAWAAPGESSP